MRDYVRRFAAAFGITELRVPARIPNTRRALAIAEYAREHDRLEPFRHAAMEAYWREGRDLEAAAVLWEVAVQAGLDPAGALAAAVEREGGRRR